MAAALRRWAKIKDTAWAPGQAEPVSTFVPMTDDEIEALQHELNEDDETRDHLVPLPWQATETIDAIRAITGRGPVGVPNARSAHKPMSEKGRGRTS